MPKRQQKGLRRDKKARAPGKQPICGLYAAAKCAGILLKSAADVEAFRKTCFANGLLEPRNGNWVGGTKQSERARICEHFGCVVAMSHHELVHGRGSISVKALLKNPEFFKRSTCTWSTCAATAPSARSASATSAANRCAL